MEEYKPVATPTAQGQRMEMPSEVISLSQNILSGLDRILALSSSGYILDRILHIL